jgi:hypothetical protein
MNKGEWVIILPFLRVLLKKVVHEREVISNLPVNAICGRIIHLLIHWLIQELLNPLRTILNHAEQKYVTWASLSLFTNLQMIRVPGISPFLSICINVGEGEVMEKPNVRSIVSVQVIMNLKVNKEVFPFLTKSVSDVVPQSLDMRIVNTSKSLVCFRSHSNMKA